MITPLSWEYIKAFSFYEKGFLPNNRGWIKESNRFIEAIVMINNELQNIKRENKDG